MASELDPETAKLLVKLEEQNKIILEKSRKKPDLSSSSSDKHTSPLSPIMSNVKKTITKPRPDNYNSLFGSEEIIEGDPIDLWGPVIADWDECLKKKHKYIKKLVKYNVPQPLRCLLWQLLSGADKQRCLIEGYAELLKRTSPHEKVIKRDIDRTYPDHPKYKNPDSPLQESMFNIMKAYSLYDKEVGYCQGNAFVAGLLLLEMPEEEAFAVFVQLMRKYNVRELCKPNMAELAVCMYQLECIIEELLPDLHIHFQAQGFRASVYASSWFLTLFASTFSLDLAVRIMDFVLAEGLEFIFRLSAAILSSCSAELEKLDIEGMLAHFQKELSNYNVTTAQALFDIAFNLKITTKKLKKYEKDYYARKAKETGDVELMKKFRHDNTVLMQKVEALENENAAFAEKIIQGTVNYAVTAEELELLQLNLNDSRKREAALQKELSAANHQIEELKLRLQQYSEIDQIDITGLPPEEINTVARLKKQLALSQQNQIETAILLRKMKTHVDDLIVNDPNSTLKLELKSANARETIMKEEVAELTDRTTDQEKKIDAYEKTIEAYKGELERASERIGVLEETILRWELKEQAEVGDEGSQ